MSDESRKPTPPDPATWPVVECEPADVYLGSFDYDCTAALTDAQRAWPVAECERADPQNPAPPRQPPAASP